MDLPPGCKRIRVGRRQDLSDVEPGDILYEHGPRIGERWWLVVDAKRCFKYDHLACQPIPFEEMAEHRRADPSGGYWHLTRPAAQA